MAWIWKTIARGMLLMVGVSVLGADGQGNGRDKKEVSGAGFFYLGQDRDIWRPLIQTAANLSEIKSIKSIFQLRTFDPEGAVFYGDTKSGEDWFVLALKDGYPLMQISKEGVLLSVTGGPKLNDGKWHTLEVSNQEKFVVLIVDGTQPLIVGLKPKMEEVLSGVLRLALGGILINTEELLVPINPQMDGCLREGTWLNMSSPWQTEEDEMWPCLENIKPGSYFPGKGFVVFNTSVFTIPNGQEIKIEFWGDGWDEIDGTICSIKNPGQEPSLSLVANKSTKEVTLTLGADKFHMKPAFRSLMITFQTDVLIVHLDGSETERISVTERHHGYSDMWKMSSLSIGGLLGEDGAGTHFLTGCLEKIQIQGKELDMNLADKEMSVYSYSCPA